MTRYRFTSTLHLFKGRTFQDHQVLSRKRLIRSPRTRHVPQQLRWEPCLGLEAPLQSPSAKRLRRSLDNRFSPNGWRNRIQFCVYCDGTKHNHHGRGSKVFWVLVDCGVALPQQTVMGKSPTVSSMHEQLVALLIAQLASLPLLALVYVLFVQLRHPQQTILLTHTTWTSPSPHLRLLFPWR